MALPCRHTDGCMPLRGGTGGRDGGAGSDGDDAAGGSREYWQCDPWKPSIRFMIRKVACICHTEACYLALANKETTECRLKPDG